MPPRTSASHLTRTWPSMAISLLLTSSLLSTLVQINRVRHLFSKDVLYIILNSLVFCKLFYCLTVWSGTSKENIHNWLQPETHEFLLQLMQNFAGSILTNIGKFDHITLVLHELDWLTMEEQLCLHDVTMIFKCLNGLVPSYLSTNLFYLFIYLFIPPIPSWYIVM